MSSSDTMTVDAIVRELTDVLEVTAHDRGLMTRLAGGNLSICYDFVAPDGAHAPHLMRISEEERSIRPLPEVDQDADIVLRATPGTLHDLTSGDLSGREAIMSGRLDIRKAPSLPKLLMMRGLFNQYKKALARGEVATGRAHTETAESDER